MTGATQTTPPPWFQVTLERNLGLELYVSSVLVLVVIALILLFFALKLALYKNRQTFDIDEAEFGIGNQRIRLRPNSVDQQIAYKIWVELSTRKIGLPIDLNDDVVVEIYDSWYNFFSVTRDLIKDVPVAKLRDDSTQKIIRLSIEVLNVGLRPHLTKWQARFRRWYAKRISEPEYSDMTPQEIQKEFPQFEEMSEELVAVNERLVRYRQQMYELVTGTNGEKRRKKQNLEK